MIKPEKPNYDNVETIEFICMDNMDLQTAIIETFSMYCNSDSEIKSVVKNHLELLLDVQYDRASLRKIVPFVSTKGRI